MLVSHPGQALWLEEPCNPGQTAHSLVDRLSEDGRPGEVVSSRRPATEASVAMLAVVCEGLRRALTAAQRREPVSHLHKGSANGHRERRCAGNGLKNLTLC